MALMKRAPGRAVAAAAGIAAVLALAGCSSSSSGKGFLGMALEAAIANQKAAKTAKTPGQISRADLAAQGGPIMRVRIASRGIDTFLVRYQQSGPIGVWTDGSGTTFTFRNGVLIESRGMGGDLMSSSAPAPGQLSGGGNHARVYFVNGAEDRNERRDYTCAAATAGAETLTIFGLSHSTRRVDEVCQRPEGRITNQYWFDGGTIRKSREWLSPSVGYVIFERVID